MRKILSLFPESPREIIPSINPDEVKDGVLVKHISPSGKNYEYEKYVTLGGSRYCISLYHLKADKEGEISISFGLAGVESFPITNAGLEIFGKIADEISLVYETVAKEESVTTLKMYAAIDGYEAKDPAYFTEKIQDILEKSPEKLDDLIMKDQDGNKIDIESGIAYFSRRNTIGWKTEISIPVTPSLVADAKHIAKVDITSFLPEMVEYATNPGIVDEIFYKKQTQRLKLFYFYLKRRFPEFTFNCKEIKKDGKTEIEFEIDEEGIPVLIAMTNK